MLYRLAIRFPGSITVYSEPSMRRAEVFNWELEVYDYDFEAWIQVSEDGRTWGAEGGWA